LNGDQVHEGVELADHAASSSASSGRSVTPSIITYSKVIRLPPRRVEPAQRVQELAEVVLLLERDQLLAQLVVGRVQRDGQRNCSGISAMRRMPGHHAHVDTVMRRAPTCSRG
jgi:hypothetical protein